jgi:hypothetical protein
MKRLLTTTAIVASALYFGAVAAKADVVVQCQTSNVTPGSGLSLGCSQGPVNGATSNIFFNDSLAVTSGWTVTGFTDGPPKTAINFTSTTDQLLVNNGGGGVATISSTTDNAINQLSYYVASTQPYGSTFNAFSEIDTNLDVQHPSGTVQFTIAAQTSLGTPETFTTVNFALTSGGNKFAFIAMNGEVITNLAYTASNVSDVTVEDVKQNQVTLTHQPGDPAPEPASLALFGVGLLGLGFVTAKRRN